MGIMDFVKGGGVTSRTKTEKVFGLTPLGKDRLKKMSGDEVSFQLMATISQNAPCTLDEITEKSGVPYSKSKHLVEQLADNGYVQVLGARGE